MSLNVHRNKIKCLNIRCRSK